MIPVKKENRRIKVKMKLVLHQKYGKMVSRTQAHKVYLLQLLYSMLQNRKFRNLKLRGHSLVVVNIKSRITLAQKLNLLAGISKNATFTTTFAPKNYFLIVSLPNVNKSKVKVSLL